MRLRIVAAVCLAVTFLWNGAVSVHASEHRARSAHAFVNSVGVNIHSGFLDTAYVQLDRVLSALGRIHVHNVRDGLLPPSTQEGLRRWQAFYFDRLAAHGVRADLILGSPRNGESSLDGYVRQVDERLPQGFVESVEGPNEYDLTGAADWIGQLHDYQQRLYEAVRTRPSLRHVPVLGPSFGSASDAFMAGDLSRWSDMANIHPYPGGLPPSPGLAQNLAYAPRIGGSKGVVATESGYHNALRDRSGWAPVSERAAAAYIPRLFLEYFKRGIARTYAYELVDERPDPWGLDREEHFGLFRNDFSPKPAAIALGHLLSLLDGPKPPARATRLDYALKGNADGVEHLLLKRAGGTFALVLWQDVSVWDQDARRDLHPPDRTLRLRLASPARIKTTRLLASDRATTARNTTHAEVVIPAADTVVVLIKP